MVNRQEGARPLHRRLGWKLLASTAIVIAAAGCNKTSQKKALQSQLATLNYSKQAQRQSLEPNHPMHIAAAKWARKHEKNPADADAAVNYVRSLKAIGSKGRAMEVAARSYQLNPGNGELASEYGRLALDRGKIQLAEQLLDRAVRTRDGADWRTLSAIGTIQAKRGDHRKAQSYYIAALKQQPGATSVYNNLALSYALDGKAGQAEQLLKNAVNKGHNTQVLRQNLALVLGIQSKFDEAQQVAQLDLDNKRIDNNVTFLRSMVKTELAKAPKRQPVQTATVDTATTAALPARKSSAPARTASKRKKAIATAKAQPKAPVPARKPDAPTQLAPMIARGLSTEQKAEMARPLPWQTQTDQKPAKKVTPKLPAKKHAPESVTASKQDKKPARTNVAALQKKPATTWTVSVNEAIGSQTTAIPQPAEKNPFKFPDPAD